MSTLISTLLRFTYFFGHIHDMQKLPGQGPNQSHSSDKARSWISWATRELPQRNIHCKIQSVKEHLPQSYEVFLAFQRVAWVYQGSQNEISKKPHLIQMSGKGAFCCRLPCLQSIEGSRYILWLFESLAEEGRSCERMQTTLWVLWPWHMGQVQLQAKVSAMGFNLTCTKKEFSWCKWVLLTFRTLVQDASPFLGHRCLCRENPFKGKYILTGMP